MTITGTETSKSPAELASAERARQRKELQELAKKATAERNKARAAAKKSAPPKAKPSKEQKTAASAAVTEMLVESVKALSEKPAPAPKPKKASDKASHMDLLVQKLRTKDGATTKELAALTGWENAGWNTILASLAKRRGLKLTCEKTTVAGSQRKYNVFRLEAN